MKITICGSIAFFGQMLKIKNDLEKLGHQVKLPPTTVKDDKNKTITVEKYYQLRKQEKNPNSWIWDEKTKAIKDHFKKIEWAEAVLILNYKKKNTPNYIGANTFLEMGLAFHFDKKIFLLNSIPEMSCTEEVLGMQPLIINNNLTLIK